MLTPAVGSTTYYKVGQNITFAWNYTSLVITPPAIDVLVTCTANAATYTLASNMSVKATGNVVWNTNHDEAGANPLLTGECLISRSLCRALKCGTDDVNRTLHPGDL